MLYFGIFYGYFIASTFKTISDLSDQYLTLVGSVGNIFNGAARIIWGAVMDKFGFKKLYLIIMTLQAILSLALWPCRNNESLYILIICASYTV